MNVTLIPKFYGYCPGLKRSLEVANNLAKMAKKEGKKIYYDVPLAHNENVQKDLEEKGLSKVNFSKTSKGEDNYFLISAHGASYDKINQLKKQKFQVVSATCPTVRKVQDIAIDDHKNGYQVVIFGKKDHAEIIGVNGCIDNSAIVINSVEDALNLKLKHKSSLISQTTFPSREFLQAAELIKKNNPDLEILIRRTICPVVEGRVTLICRYAKENKFDLGVVVGSKTSINTKQLASKLSEVMPTLMVGDEAEIDKKSFKNIENVLVVSGTSAPPEIVEAVAHRISSFK